MDFYKLPIAKDGFVYIIILMIISIVLYFVFFPLFIISLLLLLFVMFFFRNPERKIPFENNIIVSHADG
jgi:phosphatidylserine decarboxylase